jgi:glutamate 5-kinase
VANLVEADALVILTDQRGLYSADPRKDPAAQFVTRPRPAILRWKPWPVVPVPALARGGMITKILAAKRAAGPAPPR